MSWMEQLVQTYNENEQFAGKVGAAGMKTLLPPVGHIVQNALIEMTLSGDGRLIHAEVVSDKGQRPEERLRAVRGTAGGMGAVGGRRA